MPHAAALGRALASTNSRDCFMASDKVLNVLFLCTRNSARSIMGEAFVTMSAAAGSEVFPPAAILDGAESVGHGNIAPATLSNRRALSKSWEEFAMPDAPVMDFVITVCDKPPAKSAPSGPVSRLLLTGASRILRCSRAPRRQRNTNSSGLPTCSSAESSCSPACRSKLDRLTLRQQAKKSASNDAARRLAAEGVGTALLLAVVIGLRHHGRAPRRRRTPPSRC